MKILVLGAGGTGGYFGGRLAEAGADVTFLVRPKRAQQLAADGLRIETLKEKFTVPVKTVLAGEVKAEYDLVMLSCKAYDLDSSIAAIAPAMGPKTLVLPLLNGISHLDVLDAAFGRERVMGGACQIASTLTPEGVVRLMLDAHMIIFGARHETQNDLTGQLGERYAKSRSDWKVSENIMLDMWEKVVFLSTLAGMTCVMRGSIGEILAAPDGRLLLQRYVASTIAVAEKEGFTPRAPVLERYQSVLNAAGSTLTASMLRDLEEGKTVEADHIVGFMLARARHHGIDDALLTVAYNHLKTYEARRAAGRLPR